MAFGKPYLFEYFAERSFTDAEINLLVLKCHVDSTGNMSMYHP